MLALVEWWVPEAGWRHGLHDGGEGKVGRKFSMGRRVNSIF